MKKNDAFKLYKTLQGLKIIIDEEDRILSANLDFSTKRTSGQFKYGVIKNINILKASSTIKTLEEMEQANLEIRKPYDTKRDAIIFELGTTTNGVASILASDTAALAEFTKRDALLQEEESARLLQFKESSEQFNLILEEEWDDVDLYKLNLGAQGELAPDWIHTDTLDHFIEIGLCS